MNKEDLEQLNEDWKRIRGDISTLKSDVREIVALQEKIDALKGEIADLKDTVIKLVMLVDYQRTGNQPMARENDAFADDLAEHLCKQYGVKRLC